MKKTTLIAVITVAVVVLAGLVTGLRHSGEGQIAAYIRSFDDCSKAGYPILETYPEQCKTPDGRTFTRVIEPPKASTTTPVGTTTATTSYATSTGSADIQIISPKPGEVITNSVVIKGKARGTWFFEASFPIEIHANSAGDPDLSPLLGQGHAEAQSDWMTPDFVPFTATVTFTQPASDIKDGFIVLMKDNPSGLPQYNKEIHIPVKFSNISGGNGTAACYVGGCSGEVCSDQKDIASNCIYKPEFACYKESYARCERQATGQCGWTETAELKSCINANSSINMSQ